MKPSEIILLGLIAFGGYWAISHFANTSANPVNNGATTSPTGNNVPGNSGALNTLLGGGSSDLFGWLNGDNSNSDNTNSTSGSDASGGAFDTGLDPLAAFDS
jgi:hypothetical protein